MKHELYRAITSFLATLDPRSPSALSHRAEDLYRAGSVDPPLGETVFALEQLELHAKELAVSHRLDKRGGDDWLLRRLAQSQNIIAASRQQMSVAQAEGKRLSPAAEWLLDNHYLVEEHVALARKHFPPGFRKQLPSLAGGNPARLPRIYDIIFEFVAHIDGGLDDEALGRYIGAYQTHTRLSLGELWSAPIMLRLALIENLRRVAMSISWKRAHRDCALAWAALIDVPADGQEGAVLALAEMVRQDPPLTPPFVAQFTQALQGRGATTTFVLAWLEQRLALRGETLEELIRAENQSQAADQASMAHCIASLRYVNTAPWRRFVESQSGTERLLRAEASGVYGRMDFATRDAYRHAVEKASRRWDLDEEWAASRALELADRAWALDATDVKGHVGYWLMDEGRLQWEQALTGKAPWAHVPAGRARVYRLLGYVGSVLLLSAAGAAGILVLAAGAFGAAWPWLALGAALAASQSAVGIVNWLATSLRLPKALPRLDFEAGIPDECRCLVVVPTMLCAGQDPAAMAESLERRYISNRDPNLWFGLLTDFEDADTEHMAADEGLLQAASAGIQALNDRYGGSGACFFLLHRPRAHNPSEGCWMGRERKRGKIEDLNALLLNGDASRFSLVQGDAGTLKGIRYVIALDADTELPWGTAWRLVGAAAHPLNRPVLDASGRSLARGFAILQPRVSVLLGSAAKSRYARLLAGQLGLDPYTQVVSDLYQDLFGQSSYVGKGIYDVSAFDKILGGRFPDNAVLSHDLLESCYARTGQCSDVELLEAAPSSYLADLSRRHRWMRGDWQIAPWLAPWVRDAAGKRVPPGLSALGWWKIFDNLRRALLAPVTLTLLVLGWACLKEPGLWTLGVLALPWIAELLPGLAELLGRPAQAGLRGHLSVFIRSSLQRGARIGLGLVFLPLEAKSALDATGRSLWRMTVSHRCLLQWRTAATLEEQSQGGLAQAALRLAWGPLLATVLAVALLRPGFEAAWMAAAPWLMLWAFSPALAWWISRDLGSGEPVLGATDRRFLRRVARSTWRYFEVFGGSEQNWLVPDNVQSTDHLRVAQRSSPTNMGLALLGNLTAHDLGYLSGGQLLERCERSLASMEKLERYRGHYYNWYDTISLQPLRPLYVSTVDSGNLVGHLRVLQNGLLGLAAAPPLPSQLGAGLLDSLEMLAEAAGPNEALAGLRRWLLAPPDDLQAWGRMLAKLARAVADFTQGLGPSAPPEAHWWAGSLERQIQAFSTEIDELLPALALMPAHLSPPLQALLGSPTLMELGQRAQAAIQSLDAAAPAGLADALALGAERVAARLRAIDALAARCEASADAEFDFLYDRQRKLLVIGYWAAERRLDQSHYDLLASEARLASYVAIASGQIPFEHWFALGRRLTLSAGSQALLSWSGSMFEYLMPDLVMPSYEGTLLDQSVRTAVARQIQYGKQIGLPWGISESCYNTVDAEGTYQYRAFGVPGLGLQRGLGDDRVVAPYASMLALSVDPQAVCDNLRQLAALLGWGAYGFYDAIDFSPARRLHSAQPETVRTFMAHHHGMSLLALGQALLGPRMQERFLAHADLRAAALLLQERIPREMTVLRPALAEAQASHRRNDGPDAPALRVLPDPNSPLQELQLLSNGRYHVMVSAAGGGYSRWNGLALTRWREDPTLEALGAFIYVSDRKDGRSWSNAYQPGLRVARHAETVFTPGRAEFRRLDSQVETHTQIAVSPEDDLEIRRVTLSNRSGRQRALVLTSYTEVALAGQASDELHRSFSGLFVQTEWLPELSGILATRRPRSAEEAPPWMFCLLGPGERGACSAETDRARFIGRGRSAQQPVALDALGPLEGRVGAVLDPCAALRCEVTLPIDGSVQLDWILGAAATREAAVALMAKYQDHRMADRIFEVAVTHSRAVLGQLGASETEARRYGQLAAGVVFAHAAFRAPGSILRRNHKSQSGLWGYAISGDLPIVLLRIGDPEHLQVVRDLLKAHAYWRLRGLAVDLVIWNEDASGYRRTLHDEVLSLIGAGAEAHWMDRPGGVYVRHIDNFPEEDRVLLQAVARIVVRAADGPLELQLPRWRELAARHAPGAHPLPVLRVGALEAPRPRQGLLFGNGSGGFTPDGREYIVNLQPGRPTPAPWVNVIANARIGTVVSERGSAYTWYGNAQLFRLTPWSNDAVSDPSGESLFIRDEDSGNSSSPLPWAGSADDAYTCRHGFGYSVFEHEADGLRTELSLYVAVDAPVKFMVLKVKNLGDDARRLSVLATADLVLGDLRSRHGMHVVTELEPLTGAILARNSFNSEFPAARAFFGCSEAQRSVSGDRAEVLGRNGDPASPAALGRRQLSDHLGPGLDPCAAIQAGMDLSAGAEREIVFILGAADGVDEAVELIRRYRSRASAKVALNEVWKHWNDKLGILYAETPDVALNVMMNGWLPYQVLSCRLWGRSGFQQSGGAYGFRDQLQDCLALLHEVPALARQHLLVAAGRQFLEGDVQHWWHPPGGRGVRSNCSDDLLWLPYAVARYVEFSGDTGVLDEMVPYLTGRALNAGEESYYDLPDASGRSGTLYEHCTRAIAKGLTAGPHGLPLMGSGDWNDGMNRVGHLGQGESVWLGFFLHKLLGAFAPLAQRRGDAPFAERCDAAARTLEERLQNEAWDGTWYRRAYMDDGRPLGSAANDECRIDSLSQSWATLAGVGSPQRRATALDATWEQLVDSALGIQKLFTPPFDTGSFDPGYIKGYLPGIRENGGQYTHAAVWTAWAFVLAGRQEQAEQLVAQLNPINHALDPAAVARYRGEPYAMPADIYSVEPHAGQAGWTWYTGSAGWYYRLLHEVVFGLDRRGETLTLHPRVPRSWATFKLHYRYYQTFYHIEFTQDPSHQGPPSLRLDGKALTPAVLALVNDLREHQVEVHFHP